MSPFDQSEIRNGQRPHQHSHPSASPPPGLQTIVHHHQNNELHMSELINNRAHRIRTLKEIITSLHQGTPPEQVRQTLKELVQECDATDIAQMEQELIAEGTPVEQIMGMCDLHASVVREILTDRPVPLLTPGHPVTTFQRENKAIQLHCQKLRKALASLQTEDPEARRKALDTSRELLHELMDIEKHYQRKEDLLFSILERHGITGPSKVMWAKDDEVRDLLNALQTCLQLPDPSPQELALLGPTVGDAALEAVTEMIFKEDRILFPMALQTLTAVEWGEIWEQSPQFGWCLIEPDTRYRPPPNLEQEAPEPVKEQADREGIALNIMPPAAGGSAPPQGSLLFPTGSLTLDQLKAIFTTLPVDLTFIDADDRVRFFSEGPDRVFVRAKAVIGRKVQHCHPPASVHLVERIINDFREGTQDLAEFWIELHKPRNRFVHIRYYALRDAQGDYAGTLEVTQDITKERALTGERRLLQYESHTEETTP